jgi:hypothetical protein
MELTSTIFWNDRFEKEQFTKIAHAIGPFIDSEKVKISEVKLREINLGYSTFEDPFLILDFCPIMKAFEIAAIALSNSNCFIEINRFHDKNNVKMRFFAFQNRKNGMFSELNKCSILFNHDFDPKLVIPEYLDSFEKIHSVTVSTEVVAKLTN